MKKSFYPFWKKDNNVKRRPPREVNIRDKNRNYDCRISRR